MISQEEFLARRKRMMPLIITGIILAMTIGIGYVYIHRNDYENPELTTFKAVSSGVLLKYDFAPELIPLLETGSSAPYSFYLGSGVGFPPMGLKLDINGVLEGTPTGTGTSEFQVCVKDVGGRSVCKTYSMTVAPKTTSTSGKTSTPISTQNTDVVQGTTRSEKWVGTYNSHNVDDFGGGWVCTRDTSAPISLCLTWKGQNFEGPIDAPEGDFKDTFTKTGSDINFCAPLPSPRCLELESGGLASCGDIYGYIDPSGNLKIDALNMEMSVSYDPKRPNPVTSAVMVGDSMTVEYNQVTRNGPNFTTSNKGSLTATKVSDSCK